MEELKIPRRIHYCWFGKNKKPDIVDRCISSWKKFCPGYEIIEWNENNFDVNICDYTRDAYKEKRWAFVSDYARCYIVNKYGGIYFDTDVELIKPIEDLLGYSAFFASEDGKYINTGLGFGSKAGNKILRSVLDDYNKSSFYKKNGKIDLKTCPIRNTEIIKNMYPNLKLDKPSIINDMLFLSKDFFCPLDYETRKICFTKNTRGIHHFSGSWISPYERLKEHLRKMRNTVVRRRL